MMDSTAASGGDQHLRPETVGHHLSQQQMIAQLRARLRERDRQYVELSSQFNLLGRKYKDLKARHQSVLFDFLPQNISEFKSLSTHAGTCSVVHSESDTHVNDIELQQCSLGLGSFASVQLGLVSRPNGSKEEVALKVVPKARIRTLVSLRNLADEITCMRTLTNAKASAAPGSDEAFALDHVVTLHSVSISDSAVFMSQSMGGSDLFALMNLTDVAAGCAGGAASSLGARLPIATVMAIARGMMAAVAAIHRCGWCHRDVKPENVLIGVDATQLLSIPSADEAAGRLQVRLCDFGLATQLPRENAAPLSQFCGSVGFFAPELASAAHGKSGASKAARPLGKDESNSDEESPHRIQSVGTYNGVAIDIFSAGATLLEVLLGRRRFAHMWMSSYEDYARLPPHRLSQSVLKATEAVTAALLHEGDNDEGGGSASCGTVGQQRRQLNALALSLVHPDPASRPTSDATVAAVRAATSMPVASRGVPTPPGSPPSPRPRGYSGRRRVHAYPQDDCQRREIDTDDPFSHRLNGFCDRAIGIASASGDGPAPTPPANGGRGGWGAPADAPPPAAGPAAGEGSGIVHSTGGGVASAQPLPRTDSLPQLSPFGLNHEA